MSALLLPEKCVLTKVAYAFWLLISLVKSAKKQKKKEDARAGEHKRPSQPSNNGRTNACSGARRANFTWFL